jgi:multiple sugar transport system permease protein
VLKKKYEGRRNSPTLLKKKARDVLLFLVPATLIIMIFKLYPAIYSLVLSFFKWDGFSPSIYFVGLKNYSNLLSSPEFYNSVIVTFFYSVAVTFGALILGLIIAVSLDKNIKAKSLYRTLYFLPVVTPTVASGVVWKYLFDPSEGAVNSLLKIFSINGPAWLNDSNWALLSVSIVGIWKRIGFCMIIYLAALQSIPHNLYEAARIDGASEIRIFSSIKIPLLLPSTLFLTITGFIESFQIFDLVYVMTYGGPVDETDVLGFFLYRYGFQYFKLGYASTIAVAIFLILFVLSIIQWRFAKGGQAY